MFKADDCRARAQQFWQLAAQAKSPEDRKRFLRMRQWCLAMDEFLRVRSHQARRAVAPRSAFSGV